MKYWRLIAAAAAGAVILSMGAFAEETELPAEAGEMIEIGEGGSEDDFKVVLTNEGGAAITSISIAVNDEEPGDNLLKDGERLEVSQDALLTLTPAPMDEVTFMPALYNMVLTFEDGYECVLHSFPFGDTDAAVIGRVQLTEEQLDDPKDADKAVFAYITYTSSFMGSEQETIVPEWARIAPVKAAEAAASMGSGEGGSGSGDDNDWCLVGGLLD